jgi:AP-2 complex subunit alpha
MLRKVAQSPIEQFSVLHNKSNICSPPTRALLLTTYLKWLNLFPEIREQILAVLRQYRYVLDAELQQRACEYLAIAEMPSEDLLQIVCDEMPPFPERESALLSRLVNKHGDASDKRTWHVGGRDVNKDKDAERYKGLSKRKDTVSSVDGPPAIEGLVAHESATNGATSPPAIENVMDSLIGLELSPAATPAATSPVDRPSSTQPLVANMARSPSEPTAPVHYTPGTDKYLKRLLYSTEGILFEDEQIQIGLKSEYHGHLGKVILYFGNKISAAFESFTVAVEAPSDALNITLPKIPSSTLEGMSQMQQVVQIECKDLFTALPILRISYLAGSLQQYTLKLPVYLTKFVEPVRFSSTDFFERWKQIGGPPLEAQKVLPIRLTASGMIDTSRNSRVVGGCKFGILDNVDPNVNNIVGAGVLHMSTAGKIGCLLRVEPNAQAKVGCFLAERASSRRRQLCRLTVRSTSEHVSKHVLDLLGPPLSI